MNETRRTPRYPFYCSCRRRRPSVFGENIMLGQGTQLVRMLSGQLCSSKRADPRIAEDLRLARVF